MKTSRYLLAFLFTLLLLGISSPERADAQIFPKFMPSMDKFRSPVASKNVAQETAAPDLQRNFDQLIDIAREKGTVAVIVGFRVEDYRPELQKSRDDQVKQREEISSTQNALLSRLSNFSVANVKQFEFIPFMAMEVSAEALETLRNSAEITSINEDRVQKQQLLSSIPLIGGSSAGTFGGFSGSGRTVAILDSGVDKTHPFFNNRVVSEACYSSTSATATSYCPGGVTQSTAPGSGMNCTGVSGCDHGTHVAGIAAGGNPSIGGSGVARNANIIAIQIFQRSTSCGTDPAPCNNSTVSDTILGLQRVYNLRTTYNIDAVNLSIGGGQYTGTCDAQNPEYKAIIDSLRAAGIASVASSGNSGWSNAMMAPACISTAISVGSTFDNTAGLPDIVSDFSNSNYLLSMLAPGEIITSASNGGTYVDKQGTSQAAPHVAGAFAVLRQKFPTDTVTQLYTRMKYSGVQAYDSRNGLIKPRLKLDTALNTSNVEPCDTSAPIAVGQTVNGALTTADCLTSQGFRTDKYTFNASAGQTIAISHSSSAFNALLILVDAAGNTIANDDNSGGGTNARIPATGFLTIPTTGTYIIYASSLLQGGGNYTLTFTGGAGCSFSVTSSGQSIAAAGGPGSFGVNTTAGCAWTAVSNASWITTTSTGSGSGTVNYTVAANTTSAQRSGTITAGGQVHTVTQAGVTATTTRRPFDFDGDGKTDLAIFRPSNGQWWINRSSNATGFATAFGNSADKIMPADYTGDGKTDIAFFRPSNGEWFVLRSENFTFFSFPFGLGTDNPVPADYDADGKADPAVFRASTATWYIMKSTGGTDILGFGASTDRPVPADYDGDGKADLAIFRPNGANGAEWWVRRSTNGVAFATTFGVSTDKAAPGDYTGDGKTDIAFFRPSNGNWFVLRSENFSFYSFPFGANGDTPAPGDYDGDGKIDAAVFRPSNSTWYVNKTTGGNLIQQFGNTGDTAVPGAFVQ